MANKQIKAIETRYKGYRFRSRLEARWAVFFDSVGLEYKYESEGYSLPSGECYLPDFFLPRWNIFAEVKPNLASAQKGGRKLLEFCHFKKSSLLLFLDTPGQHQIVEIDASFGFDEDSDLMHAHGLEVEIVDGPRGLVLTYRENLQFNVTRAIERARSARFEFGENG